MGSGTKCIKINVKWVQVFSLPEGATREITYTKGMTDTSGTVFTNTSSFESSIKSSLSGNCYGVDVSVENEMSSKTERSKVINQAKTI